MKVTRLLASTLAATLLTAAALAAQHATRVQAPTKAPSSHRTTAMTHRTTAPNTPRPMSFKGIANKLGTTPDALESAYQTALAANAKLTRGQFVAANVLAKNLGDKNPAMTTQAILDGLKRGKSIARTRQPRGGTPNRPR